MVRRLSFTLAFVLSFALSLAQTFWLEAECGLQGTGWQAQSVPNTSGDTILQSKDPAYVFNPSFQPGDWLRMGLQVDSAGDYTLHGRAQVLDPASNSLWYRVNSGPWYAWENMGYDRDSVWAVPPTNLPVIPGAKGFGIETPAGRGGTIYKVTHLNDSGTGSFRACAEANGPRVCVFEVGGFIDLNSTVTISDPYLTVAGQTAPSPGITLGKGYGIRVETHDVLIQHLSILPGDQAGNPYKNRDAIQLVSTNANSRVDNVVIDHVSMAWSMDENLDLWGYIGDVSILNCIIAQNLHLPYDPVATSSYGNLIGSFDQQNHVFISGCFYAGNRDRQPLSRVRNLLMTNNLMYDRVLRFIYLSNRLNGGTGGFPTRNTILGNAFIEGPSMGYNLPQEKPITFDQNGQLSTSKLYVADNHWSFATYANDWQYVRHAASSIQASTPPVSASLPGLSYETDPQLIISNVLEKAGARPADRSLVDKTIIDGFTQGDSLVRECVSGCPSATIGWPTLGITHRPLLLPNQPHSDDDNDGYTNLEEWLHKFSQAVELGNADYQWTQALDYGTNGQSNPVYLSLDTGVNVIDFAVREAGVNLDKLCISRDGVIPTNLGGPSLPCSASPNPSGEILLPVTLLSFTATPDQQNGWINLDWTTSSERNHDYFLVERSADGQLFLPMAEFPGKGDSSSRNDYHFRDASPINGPSYYRLRQTDLNGAIQFYGPLQVEMSPAGKALKWEVYPVPIGRSNGGSLQVSLWSDMERNLDVRLLNALGQTVWQRSLPPFVGWQELRLPVSTLSPGFHTVQVYSPSEWEGPSLSRRIWIQ